MKKLFILIALASTLTFIGVDAYAQETTSSDSSTEAAAELSTVEEAVAPAVVAPTAAEAPKRSFHQVIKQQFIDGGPTYMTPILLCLIIGLAIAIERIISLSLSATNTKKLLSNVESALNSGGVEAAKEVCRNTRGPVASIFIQGLMRVSEGVDMVEKSIVSYGSVEMNKLEKGMIWVSLFIALAPMLGFLGTVIGMIEAFDAIAQAGDVSPTLVAGGIKVALITTVGGLIVAMILQVFYNYLISKIDSIVNNMEDASISLVDMVVRHNLSKK